MEQEALEEYSNMNPDEATKLLDINVPTPVDSKVLQYLITRCSLLLRAYATTMDRDQELLTEIKDCSVTRNNIQLRLCEKKMLVNAVAFCEQKLKST